MRCEFKTTFSLLIAIYTVDWLLHKQRIVCCQGGLGLVLGQVGCVGMLKSFKKIFRRGKRPSLEEVETAENIARDGLGTDHPSQPSPAANNADQGPSERLGLLPLFIPPGDNALTGEVFNVDIVAVHGLNGDAYNSWKHHNGILWLQDLLPKSLPGARIFSYGYPSRLFFNKSVAGIRDYAQRLLSSLISARDDDKETRNIIFVCHSLGGIVCKQALILANEDDRYQNILSATTAVLFLGTPHRGASGTPDMAKLIGNIVNACLLVSGSRGLTGNTKTHLLDTLSANSAALEDIATSFRNRSSNLSIVTFYETETTPPVGQLIVDKWSAIMGIPNEEVIPLYANHLTMCRFPKDTNQEYLEVSKALKRLARKAQRTMRDSSKPAIMAPSNRSLNEIEKTCMTLFNMSFIADYKSDLPSPVEGTCQWVLANPQYICWLSEKDAGLLWMTGVPGCGKTILSSFISDYLQATQSSQDLHALVCFFFCDEKIEHQRDGKAILQSVIYQIVTRRRDLIRYVTAAYEIQGPHLVQSFDALWNIFKAIVSDISSGPISIVVDAIDECEEKTRNKFLDSVSKFIHQVKLLEVPIQNSIRFLITSRPYVTIARRINGHARNHLQIEESQTEISKDVRLVIHQKVEEIVRRSRCGQNIQDFLKQYLYAKADQTFLWVTIVLQHLERSLLASERDFKRIVNELPRDLGTLYERFLETIPMEHQQLAVKLLQIITGSSRPLTLDEIGVFLTIHDSHRHVSEVEADSQPSVRRTVQGILGPLVRISDSRVYLIHQSAKEFLHDLSNQKNSPMSVIYGINEEAANLVLASSCVSFLLLDDFMRDLFSTDHSSTEESSPLSPVTGRVSIPDEENSIHTSIGIGQDLFLKDESLLEADACDSIAARYKLFDYAARYWPLHYSLCDKVAHGDLQAAAVRLSGYDGKRFSNWFRYYWLKAGVDLEYAQDFDQFAVASFFGHSTTLLSLLEPESPPDPRLVAYALYWASRMGHRDIVEILLRQDLEPESRTVDRQSPLNIGAQLGHFEVVEMLIADERVNVNFRGKGGRTPISLAAGNGHLELVKVLLGHNDIEVDMADFSQWTALFWAVGGNFSAIVRLLVADGRIDINHTDKEGRTAFSWAAGDGMLDLVKYFLSIPHVHADLKDGKGRTALSWAAGNGHPDIVRLLARSKHVDISGKDGEGRNAISWACAGGHTDVLKVLIKYDRDGVDEDDQSGWTPLAWAMDKGYLSVVETLIGTGVVDVNRKDRNGRSALSWAAGYGYLDIVRLLMSVGGADSRTEDNDGRTPLSWARINGSHDIVMILQKQGI